jgi:hypothetical protein
LDEDDLEDEKEEVLVVAKLDERLTFDDKDEVFTIELDDLVLLEDFAELNENETEATEETETELLMLDKALLLDKTATDFEEAAPVSDSF